VSRDGRLSSRPYLLLTTVPSRQEAKKIAAVLLKARIAACVNIIPSVESFFHWQGSIDRAHEQILMIKTRASHLRKVEKTIRKLHSYQVPEIIGWPVPWGYKPYLNWLARALQK
jgi:periplasmic divalent cation tolerance protein